MSESKSNFDSGGWPIGWGPFSQECQVADGEVLFFAGEQTLTMDFVVGGQLAYRSEVHHAGQHLLNPGQWLSEVVLWLNWVTVGRAIAKTII